MGIIYKGKYIYCNIHKKILFPKKTYGWEILRFLNAAEVGKDAVWCR